MGSLYTDFYDLVYIYEIYRKYTDFIELVYRDFAIYAYIAKNIYTKKANRYTSYIKNYLAYK